MPAARIADEQDIGFHVVKQMSFVGGMEKGSQKLVGNRDKIHEIKTPMQ